MDIEQVGQRCRFSRSDFPVDIHRSEHHRIGTVIECHWHENFEILYFEKGAATVYCNSQPIQVETGDLIIINSNDLHYCESRSEHLIYYVVEFDLTFIQSNQIDLCQLKYMVPLVQNRFLFRNQIEKDSSLREEILQLISEYYRKEFGYELSVKSYIYRVLVLLLRYYKEQTISEAAKKHQRRTLACLAPVLEYMEAHYTEKLTLDALSSAAHMSSYYFCRLFKSFTGKSPTAYITHLRLNKAAVLLQENKLNITEVALTVGFSDSNYFSRQFKKYKKVAPSKLQK
ncbi:AraC family transcriptional regulator [Anaerosinus massiliensis]|uniref:AraC family transcriptional regulator n=1 Tax=Massilibacillus massiliensis TaxID=1806837 RepID=UPI000AC6BCF7|nr:AraC family transcriptional regulator [Massilibacillus massiliensis]